MEKSELSGMSYSMAIIALQQIDGNYKIRYRKYSTFTLEYLHILDYTDLNFRIQVLNQEYEI